MCVQGRQGTSNRKSRKDESHSNHKVKPCLVRLRVHNLRMVDSHRKRLCG